MRVRGAELVEREEKVTVIKGGKMTRDQNEQLSETRERRC